MPKDNKDEANVRRSTPRPFVTALVSLAVALTFALSRLAGATTVNANSASQSDVAAAIASAADGDTVTIPGGTASWTRTLVVRKAITLQGAGVGVTIIRDNVQSGQLILWTLAAGRPSRLTGIEFKDGGRATTAVAPGGIFHINGSSTNGSSFRWDHCKWDSLNGFVVANTVKGVFDHNAFVRSAHPFQLCTYVYGTNWNNGTSGDGSWAAPTGYGSDNFLFFEDNTFTNNGAGLPGVTDAFAGARFVVRHNTIYNAAVFNHGTESGGRERGARAQEIYNNTFTGTNVFTSIGGSRSGGTLLHDNTISGYGANPVFNLGNWRNFFPFNPWGGADGTNAWDVNEPNAFFTATAAANSSGTTVTVSGANWIPNQWAGYTIRRTSNVCNSTSITFAWIRANTSNTITYTDNGGYRIPSLSFCAGDSLEIRKVDHAQDQPGRAGGSLITGDTPVRPRNWNDQVTEPCYSWNNGQANFSGGPGVRANVHFFNNTPMTGYTEYVYPHPLVTGNPPPSRTPSSPAATRTSLRKPWGKKEKKTTHVKRKPWKRTKENATNEMAEGQENLGN